MACCGKDVLVEIKDDEKYDDWSNENIDPDKIVPFPANNSERDSGIGEVLLYVDDSGNKIDHRVQVFFNRKEFHTRSYFMLCQVIKALGNGKSAGGTASCIPNKNPYFLTCAHNLMKRSGDLYESLKVYQAMHGKKSCLNTIIVKKGNMVPHPKYDGYPLNGFDIGIFRSSKSRKNKVDENTYGSMETIQGDVLMHFATADLKVGMAVEIAGYPVSKKLYPYKHEGKIERIQDTKRGSQLIWYNADTTKGNSGSSIVVTDQNFVRSVTKEPGIKKIIIGVHSGYDPVTGKNFGTLITEELYCWIKKNGM